MAEDRPIDAAPTLDSAEGGASRPPYLLWGVLGLLGILVLAAGMLVYLGHPATPGDPVITPLHPASPATETPSLPAASASGAQPPKPGTPAPAAATSASALPGQPVTGATQPSTPAVPLSHPKPLTSPPADASAPHPPTIPAHALNPAPDPDLIERGTYGFMPIAGQGDDKPWKVYARPFDQTDQRPRIAIMIVGLGVSQSGTDSAIRNAPPEMSLAFAPFARRLGQWMNLARDTGHETLLELPMEPVDYPQQDPGFNALLTALSPKQNLDRLGWVMSQAAGYVGLVGRLGGRFSASAEAMKPILEDIAKRGLIYVDNKPTGQTVVARLAPAASLPFADINRYVDMDPNPAAIDRSLSDLEDLAKRKGSAIGAASPNRATVAKLVEWSSGLAGRGIVLAPITALVTAPAAPSKADN